MPWCRATAGGSDERWGTAGVTPFRGVALLRQSGMVSVMRLKRLLPALVVASLSACGDPARGTQAPGATAQLITIRNYQSYPQRLTVVAGSSVLVRNDDEFDHTVTSQSAPGLYTRGAVDGVSFDTGAFTGFRTTSIPAEAKPGTLVPYYCATHGAAEANQGELLIAAP